MKCITVEGQMKDTQLRFAEKMTNEQRSNTAAERPSLRCSGGRCSLKDCLMFTSIACSKSLTRKIISKEPLFSQALRENMSPGNFYHVTAKQVGKKTHIILSPLQVIFKKGHIAIWPNYPLVNDHIAIAGMTSPFLIG